MIETLDDYILQDGSVGCSLPDLRFVAYAAAALTIVAALAIVIVNKLRPW